MNDGRMQAAQTLAVLLLLALTALIAAPGARSQDAPPSRHTVDDYGASVRSAARLLHGAPTAVDAARRELATVEQVELRSGEVITVTPLLGAAGDERDGASAQARLWLVAQQLDAAAADQTATRLAVLEGVLAGAAFQSRESWLDQLRRWLANLLQQWLGASDANVAPTPVSAAAAQVVGWSFLVAGGALLLVVLVRWLQTLLHAFVGDAVRQERQEDETPATPAAARIAAGRLAEQGDYRAAVRQLYLAALLTLQERRIVARDPSLTNREVLARTPALHPVHAPLAAAIAVFDEVWYAVREPDEATFSAYRTTVDAIERCAADSEKEAPTS